MPNQNQKKRHHYIPIAYLNQFTDESGRIYAYRKDEPKTPLYLKPDNIGFERYYYSQPLPEGGHDNNKLKDFLVRTNQRGLLWLSDFKLVLLGMRTL